MEIPVIPTFLQKKKKIEPQKTGFVKWTERSAAVLFLTRNPSVTVLKAEPAKTSLQNIKHIQNHHTKLPGFVTYSEREAHIATQRCYF